MIIDTINLLGLRAKDKVTGFEGTVVSVSFDLYGCVQVVLNPGLGKDGKPQDPGWYDVQRLEVLKKHKRVMPVPTFTGKPENYDHGPAEKPLRSF